MTKILFMNEIQKSQFKSLDFIFISFLSSQLLAVFTIYFIKSNNFQFNFEIDSNFIKIVVMLLNITAIILSKTFYSILIKRIKVDESLDKKITSFRTVSIFRLSFVESVNLINVLAYLFTGDYLILIIFFIMLILFFTYRPTTRLLIKDFNLSNDEKRIILESA